ncbi:MAG: NAD-dependent epimerase/dehydratase family protein [Rhodospirillales bacterium]|nr:NAD-dependent epimerase/dehydratase family protein [Rhodospirillales bacterium]
MSGDVRILVTGASGFVGSAVVRQALARGYDTRAFVRPGSDLGNLEGVSVKIAYGDLEDRESMANAIRGCDGLFHVAADYRLWTRDPDAMYRVNVDGTRALMEIALRERVSRIVHTSSVATLGIRPNGVPADEDTPVALADMIGPYKRSKFLAEDAVARLVRENELPAVIVNPSTPIGPRDIRPTPTGRMIVEAARGRMPAYVDTGLNVVHVDDVGEGHLRAFEEGAVGERYILGGEDMSLAAILAEIAAITDRRSPQLRLPHGLIMPFAYVSEAWCRIFGGDEPMATVDGVRMARKKMFFASDKARRLLGYAPRPAREALVDAVAWFRRMGYCQ